MTQEEKSLLLQDLSARLPYGVIVRHADCLVDSDGNYTRNFWYKRGYLYNICRMDNMTTTIIESEGSDEEGYEHICDLERSLPYLRSMSSMTDEEKSELKNLQPRERLAEIVSGVLEFYCKYHLDYNRLIEKNLALEASERMYKID